jgi:hypothetical protein
MADLESFLPGFSVQSADDQSVTLVDPAGQTQVVPRQGLPPDISAGIPSTPSQQQGMGGLLNLRGPSAANPIPGQQGSAAPKPEQGFTPLLARGAAQEQAPQQPAPAAMVDPEQAQFLDQDADPFANPFLGGNPNEVLGTIGGGVETTTNRQVTQGVDLDAERQMLGEATDQQAEAIRRQAEVAAQTNSQIAQIHAQEAENALATEARVREVQAEGQAESDRIMGQIDELRESISSFEVDPDRIWKEKGTGAKVVAAIGAALGAMGSALTGGPNAALSIIENAIDRDVQAQRDELGKRMRGMDDLRGSLAAARSMTNDAVEAELGARILGREAAMAKLEGIRAQGLGEEADARAEQLAGELMSSTAMLQAQLAQHAQDRVTVSSSSRRVPGQQITRGMMAAQEEERLGFQEHDPERYVPEAGGNARTVDEAKELRSATAEAGSLRRLLNRAASIAEGKEGSKISPADRKRAEALGREIQLVLKSPAFLKLGILTGPDLELLEQISPSNPAQIFQVGNANMYRDIATRTQNSLRDKMRQQVIPLRQAPATMQQRQGVSLSQLAGPEDSGAQADFQRGL